MMCEISYLVYHDGFKGSLNFNLKSIFAGGLQNTRLSGIRDLNAVICLSHFGIPLVYHTGL